jgi:hypothetical protein
MIDASPRFAPLVVKSKTLRYRRGIPPMVVNRGLPVGCSRWPLGTPA